MGYKPLEDTTLLTTLQTALRGLEFPTMQGFPILAIDDEGFDFADGIAKLKEPPPDLTEILAHLADDDIHGSHAAIATQFEAQKRYCLKCTDTPGATGISPAIIDYAGTNYYIDFLCWFRLDAELDAEKIIYRRKTQTDSRIAIGITVDYEFFIDVGTTRYIPDLMSEGGGRLFDIENIGQWIELGCCLNNMDSELIFYLNGVTETKQFVYTTMPSATEELIDVGSAGISLASLAVVHPWRPYIYGGGKYYAVPVAPRRPALAWNYWNFKLVSGVIPDLAIPTTYKHSLAIQSGKATVEEYSIV